MNVLRAAEIALKDANAPLHYKEITQRMIDRGLWQNDGKTPDATVNAAIAVDIKYNGTHSLFQRADKGVYVLRDWDYLSFTRQTSRLLWKLTRSSRLLKFPRQSRFLSQMPLSKYSSSSVIVS
jgi:hypothetical protein